VLAAICNFLLRRFRRPDGCEVMRSSCLYACMSVCLFARISQKPDVQTSRNFRRMLPVAVARFSSDDNAIRYVLPVLWMTSCFHIMERIQMQTIRELFTVTRQVAPLNCALGLNLLFLPCGFYLSIFLSFFIPRLISAAADWMSTILRHMVWP